MDLSIACEQTTHLQSWTGYRPIATEASRPVFPVADSEEPTTETLWLLTPPGQLTRLATSTFTPAPIVEERATRLM